MSASALFGTQKPREAIFCFPRLFLALKETHRLCRRIGVRIKISFGANKNYAVNKGCGTSRFCDLKCKQPSGRINDSNAKSQTIYLNI